MMKYLSLIALLMIGPAHTEQPDAYSGAAPPHFYFDHDERRIP
jgi:hypothetical protein